MHIIIAKILTFTHFKQYIMRTFFAPYIIMIEHFLAEDSRFSESGCNDDAERK